ncbi:hypothetical protein F5882DRAFT_410417 [Hyaloscypha sp. PMI_1271]|nr:hypothetical protein F5882DRAFT_410417 [Hyaloscypha sp. PMI_1271]
MDADPESVKNQQTEPPNASFSNARALSFHHPYSYNPGVAHPGISVPSTSYTICPTNSAVEQLVPGGSGARFPSGVYEDWTGHESFGAAFSQIQDLQLSTNLEADFDSAPPAETRALYFTPGHQDESYDTAAHFTSPNGIDLPQAGTVVHTSSDTHSYYLSTEQQDWYNELAGHDNMANGFDAALQCNTAHDPFMNGFGYGASANLFHSNGTGEASHFSGNDIAGTQPSSISCNTERGFSFSAPFQVSIPTYGTSAPIQEGSTRATISPSSPETSFSTISTTSPTPSPTNAPSPNSTRHPCPHPHCHSTFARTGDLSRHAKIHSPERHREYPCQEPGCGRNRRGFTRRDKLRDHVRRVHGLDEDGVVSEYQVEAGWN